jgi:hypothetical protein
MKRKFHTVKTMVLSKGEWKVLDTQKGIFIEDNLYDEIYNWSRPEHKYARKLTSSDVENAVINVTTSNIHPIERTFEKNEAYTNTSVSGFIKLSLNYPDFGHAAYPEALRKAAMNVTVTVTPGANGASTMVLTPAPTVPGQPYTPTIKSFAVNYTASVEIELQDTTSQDKEGAFYHLSPFGFGEVNKVKQKTVTLLPNYDNEGELYVGLENVLQSSTLKVLFEVADGTSNPLKQENDVDWYYLSSNNWKLFESTDVIDATKNFTQSGIVTFIFHDDINNGNTFFDPTLYWLKAVVKKDADAVCKLISVQAQAIKATLQEDRTKNIYFKSFLVANTISKLLIADASVKKITQPYESFAGRVAEQSEKFYTRVSERLRHKQRGIAAWDYEKIILEQFPAVYKAKCINHTGLIPTKVAGVKKYSETVPGHVTIVTIPDIRNHSLKNPLKPYTSIGLLTNIKDYLLTIISPFVKLHVINPKFEEVQFEFFVKIVEPLDETFFVKQLSIDIEQFLCPWAYESTRDIEFGGKISKSVVLNFIEERYYVDYVTCFKLHHIVERGVEEYHDVEEAKTTTGISILVSYYDEVTDTRHQINQNKACDC